MATARNWLAGARPRTLPAALVPVAVGTGVATGYGDFSAWRAVLALVVALALQIGVNYANDYSDGIRGTDEARVGPVRLVAAGLAPPRQVLAAAIAGFAVACVAGLVLAATTTWWLLAVGAAAVAAAWTYTGGPRPYGYEGFGELAVLVFFGLVATTGTAYVQTERLEGLALAASVPVGLGAVAILLANNVRDLEGDRAAGKRTLVVRLGLPRSRSLFLATVAAMFVAVALIGIARPTALAALAAVPLAVAPVRLVRRRRDGPGLLAALAGTARLQLAVCVLLAAGLWVS